MIRFLGKRELLTGLSLLFVAVFVSSGQTWYRVSIIPNDSSLVIKSFDGFTSYPWISPFLLVALAAFALAFLLKPKLRAIVFFIGSCFSLTLTGMTAYALATNDLRNLSTQLEAATGIATTHGIDGLDISISPAASISILGYFLLGLVFFLASFSQKNWIANVAKAQKNKAQKAPKDSISLWDEQR